MINLGPADSNSRFDLSLNSSNDSALLGSSYSNNTPTTTPTATIKTANPKPFSILSRAKSIRGDGPSPSETTHIPIVVNEPERGQVYGGTRGAPIRPEHDRNFREIMTSSLRNRSVDWQPQTERAIPENMEQREQSRIPSSLWDNNGQGFLNNLKSSSSKAINAGRGFLNKVSRSGSANEREDPIDDKQYVLKVINLPLVEQTRLTRISKRLEDSRDKTEFWMPAFPWRAIDYVNCRGTDIEGLYNVSGSVSQIKKWQRRFDEGK